MQRSMCVQIVGSVLASTLPATSAASQSISVGQTVEGRITADDPQLDGRRYDCWVFDAPPGHYVIEQRSEELDPAFSVGFGTDCKAAAAFEQSYGGRFNGTNRRNQDAYVVFLTDGGPRFIRAQSGERYQGDAAYQLTLARAESTRAASTLSLVPDRTVTGRISADDGTWSDGAHFDCWALDVPPGRYRARLRTDAFDGVLTVGRGYDCRRGRETDSLPNVFPVPSNGGRVDLEFRATGEPWYVAVHTFGAGDVGEYRLTLVPLD